MNKWDSVSVKNMKNWLELKIQLFFAATVNGNATVVECLFKGKPGGFV